jgi:N-sulfoglucosamine sulfohydrolase
LPLGDAIVKLALAPARQIPPALGRIEIPIMTAVATRSARWFVAFCSLAIFGSSRAPAAQPNFVIFIADDLGAEDLGCYGNPKVGTPHIDKLAGEGMLFQRAFLTCSSCSPSRASILTGRYPHNTGAEQLHWPVPADQVTLAKLLRAKGYWTAAVGKWHLGPALKSQFNRVIERPGQWTEAVADRPRDQPFFFWLASTDPHRPYQPNAIAKPHQPQDATVSPYMSDTPETRQDLAMYYDEISRFDDEVGQVLSELDRQGVAGDTMILVLSDNGRPFPRCKTTLYNSGIQTPLVIRWPGHTKPGSVSESLVSSIDLAPTILRLANIDPPASFQGVSLTPLLKDAQAAVRPYAFAEHNWHDYTAYDRAVRNRQYLYIRNGYTDLPLTPPADAVGSPTFQSMRKLRESSQLTAAQQGCFTAPRPAEELYDTEADPQQLVNLAANPKYTDPKYTAMLQEFRAALDEWQQQTGDRMPEVRTPDEFDRQTGESLSDRRGPRAPKPGQRAERETNPKPMAQ